MKVPRFRLAWAMAIVALAASNIGAIRAWSDVKATERLKLTTERQKLSLRPISLAEYNRLMNNLIRADLMVSGALPMGNILALGLLIGCKRRGSRPFFLGFEAFGATALAIYIVGVSCSTEEGLRPYLWLVIYPLQKSFGPSPLAFHSLIVYSVFAAIFVLPQIVSALIGGFFFLKNPGLTTRSSELHSLMS